MSVIEELFVYEKIKTIFSTLPAQFPLANDTSKIKTREFLNASLATVFLLERIGKLFAPIIYDMNSNLKQLKEKYEGKKKEYEYLEDMILDEKEAGQTTATDALLWLRRALHFVETLFQQIIDDSNKERSSSDLTAFVTSAYSGTLEEYHGWLGKQLFNVLSRFAPNRNRLMYILALDKPDRDAVVIRDMKNYAGRLTSIVRRLTQFYRDNNLEPPIL
ncbi:hypothetical protein NQ315_010844 [Exocentrus adspersus]|uniref:Glycolipid transfer protein domain-containing protein n=1 Tax=Exocentrus adspersus TaxID=1586481 RepID=A0AAV8V637_9CUCU|nr:hypothetical protein NQ315_010844 [Exocentrus adspersus]